MGGEVSTVALSIHKSDGGERTRALAAGAAKELHVLRLAYSTSVPALRVNSGPGLGHGVRPRRVMAETIPINVGLGGGTVVQKIATGATVIHSARRIGSRISTRFLICTRIPSVKISAT